MFASSITFVNPSERMSENDELDNFFMLNGALKGANDLMNDKANSILASLGGGQNDQKKIASKSSLQMATGTNVLIHSDWRRGASIISTLFNSLEEVFYVSEPLILTDDQSINKPERNKMKNKILRLGLKDVAERLAIQSESVTP